MNHYKALTLLLLYYQIIVTDALTHKEHFNATLTINIFTLYNVNQYICPQ